MTGGAGSQQFRHQARGQALRWQRNQEITMGQERKRGEMPPHREGEEARQQEAQEDARPNNARSADKRGRDKGRSGSDSNA